ncbi:MAG TPA: peptide ABC transporter substrate-binding protein [Ktedonobacterales bacterium]|nr:peptide ABC transporter substrate-binding protein [Ktedonobacterales bacterium]
MLRKRSLWSVAGLLVVLTMMLSALSACGGTTTGGSGGTPVKGGTVIDGISQEPNALLPERSNQTYSLLVQAAFRTPLFASNDKAGISPALATEVPTLANGGISSDGLTYKIHVRTGTKWSDGQPVTGDDVFYTFKLFMDPAYSARDGFQQAASEISTISQPDSNTITFTLKKPDAAFIALYLTDVLAFAPLPKHVYGTMTPDALVKSNESFQPTVTNGPFKVSGRVQGDNITVVRDDNYVGAHTAYLDKIVFKVFADAQTIVTAMQAGQVDTAYFLPVSQYDTLKNIPGYSLVPSTVLATFEAWYLNINGFQLEGKPATDEPLSDPVVREALAISFDTKQEIHTLWHDIAKPVCDESIGTFGFDPQLVNSNGYCAYGPDGKSFDNGGPDAAKAMLDADGWKVGSDGIRVKNGHRLSLRIATTSGRKYREDSEALAQAAWKNIGVELKTDNHPSGDLFGPILFPSTGKGNTAFDIAEYATGVGVYPDNRCFFNSKFTPQAAGCNPGYYSNPTVDQLTEQAVTISDQAQAKAILTQIHQAANKDVPIIWLYGFPNLNEANSRLHNYKPSGEGPDETWNVVDWWLTGGKR